MRDRMVWLLRVLWFVLPITVGSVLADALADCDDGFRLGALVLAWTGWALGLLCVAVLLPATLTGSRVLAPFTVVAAAWSVADRGVDVIGIAAVVFAVAVTAVAMSPLVGDRMVDGASYGDERRMLLRPPTRLALVAAPLTWLVVAAGAVTGIMLLFTGRWLAGAALAVVGVIVAGLGVRALHQLSRRWAVFVPTGFVLHDLQVLTEPVLFRRTAIERLGVAIQGTPARDLTNRAAGLIVECELADPAPLGLRPLGRSDAAAELIDVRRFLFTPSLPGELLDEAERRGIAVS